MLPAIAASISIRNGTPIAADQRVLELLRQRSRPGPSVWIIQELAIRLRSGTRMPSPIEPEKVDSTSVAAGDHEPGVDLLALGDVAALERIVEAFLRRVFCFVGIVIARRPSVADLG